MRLARKEPESYGAQSNEAYMELVTCISKLLPSPETIDLNRRLNLMLRAAAGQPHRWSTKPDNRHVLCFPGDTDLEDRVEIVWVTPLSDHFTLDELKVFVGTQDVTHRLEPNTIELLETLYQVVRCNLRLSRPATLVHT